VASHGRGVLVGSITTLPEKPQATTLVSPSTNVRGILPDTVLTWNSSASAVSYTVRLQVEGRPDLARTIQGVTDTKLDVKGLVQGPVTYSWNVEPYGGGGAGPISDTWTFSTAVRPPALLVPANGEKDVLQANLTWERLPQATSYGIEVSPNAAFNPVIVHIDNHPDTSILVRGLDNNKRYFWRVRSANADAVGIYSERSAFVTGVLSDVAGQPDVDCIVRPNPTADRIVVTYAELDGSVVVLCDVAGRIMQQHVAQGSQLELDLRMLSAGSYTLLIRKQGMTTQSYSVTKIQ
jgi:hypothetical protein